MKTKNITAPLTPFTRWLLPMVAALLVAGCSRDDAGGTPEGSGDEILFSAGIATRTTAGGTQWLTSDRIGICLIDEFGVVIPEHFNVPYRPEENNMTSTGLVAVDRKIWWPEANKGYYFLAYYPWQENMQSDGIYRLNVADQTAELDLLIDEKGAYRKGEMVSFLFPHRMSKIRVNISRNEDIALEELDGMEITLNGMPTTAECELLGQNNEIRYPGNVSPIVMVAADKITAGCDATFEAIVIPAGNYPENFPGRSISITTPRLETRVQPISDELNFINGHVHVYNLRITEQGIRVIDSYITPWQETDPTPGTFDDLEILPESNCYMLEPGSGPVLIPVSRAGRAIDPEYNLGADATGLGGVVPGNYTVETVWRENGVIKTMIPYSNNENYIYLEPGIIKGNAVISIKVAGIIKWSWHIWVTDEVGFATDNGTGLTWMDRNLGAAGTTWNEDGKNGLYYQWGRKDAFPDASGLDPATNTFFTLSQLVQNPGVFTTYSSFQGSAPNTSSTTNPSWGESGQKTIYDPCPPGWRVPPILVGANNSWGEASNWNSFVNYDQIFKGVGDNLSIYYPAAGYRYDTTGALTNPGSHGYYWSATVLRTGDTQGAYTLNISSGYVYPINTSVKADGFSIRCVSEF